MIIRHPKFIVLLSVFALLAGLTSIWPTVPPASATSLMQTDEWTGADVVLVIDQSGSETTTDPKNVRFAAAKILIDALRFDNVIPGRGKAHRASAVLFGTKVLTFDGGSQGWADLSSEQEATKLQDWLTARTTTLLGETDYLAAFQAVKTQLAQGRQTGRRQLVVMLTDGVPSVTTPDRQTLSLNQYVAQIQPYLSKFNQGRNKFLLVGNNDQPGNELDSFIAKLTSSACYSCVDKDKAIHIHSSAEFAQKLNPILSDFLAKEPTVNRTVNTPFFVAPYLNSATFFVARPQVGSAVKVYYLADGPSGPVAKLANEYPEEQEAHTPLNELYSIPNPQPGWWVVCADQDANVTLQTSDTKYRVSLDTTTAQVTQFHPLNLNLSLLKATTLTATQALDILPAYPVNMTLSIAGGPSEALTYRNNVYPLRPDLVNTNLPDNYKLTFSAQMAYREPALPVISVCNQQQAAPAPVTHTVALVSATRTLEVVKAAESWQAHLVGPTGVQTISSTLQLEIAVTGKDGNAAIPVQFSSKPDPTFLARIKQGINMVKDLPLQRTARGTFASLDFQVPPTDANGSLPYQVTFLGQSGSATILSLDADGDFDVSALSPYLKIDQPTLGAQYAARLPQWSLDWGALNNGVPQTVPVRLVLMQNNAPAKDPATVLTETLTNAITATLFTRDGAVITSNLTLRPDPDNPSAYVTTLSNLPVGAYRLVAGLTGNARYPNGKTKLVSSQVRLDFARIEGAEFSQQQSLLGNAKIVAGVLLALLLAWLFYTFTYGPKGYLEVKTTSGQGVAHIPVGGLTRTVSLSKRKLTQRYAATGLSRIIARRGARGEDGKPTIKLTLAVSGGDGEGDDVLLRGETVNDNESIGLGNGMNAIYHST